MDQQSLQQTGTRSPFARAIAKAAIGVIGLVAIGFVVNSLPMLRESGSVLKGKLTLIAIANMLIGALVLGVVIKFALDLQRLVQDGFPHAHGLGTAVADLIFLFAASFAYLNFRPLGSAFETSKRVYAWIFLGLASIPLIQLVVLFFRNMDLITTLIVTRLQTRSVRQRHVEYCPNCGYDVSGHSHRDHTSSASVRA